MVHLSGSLSNSSLVREEPTFLRRMREGFQQEENKVEEKRRRRGSEEIIDEDEAPQVVIQDKDKHRINEGEARLFVAEKEGVKTSNGSKDTSEQITPRADVSSKPIKENVSMGMKKAKKAVGGLKRVVEDEKDVKPSGKSKKVSPRKDKRPKLSFEEDE